MTSAISANDTHVNYNQKMLLEQYFQEVKDEQGFLGSIWNGVKEITTLGFSESDCESKLEEFNNGQISFEEAVQYIEDFENKQKNMSGLMSNILTGAGAIAIATSAAVSGGLSTIGWGLAFAKGAPIGAALKTGINFLDRATNDVEGDALDAKQMTKDAISGAMTGAASAVSSASALGYKALINNGALTKGTLGANLVKGALCGVECGAMSGATSYMTDVAFGDREFSFGDLTKNTLTSAAISGVVGGTVGAGMHGLDKAGIAQVATDTGRIIKDTCSSSARKIGGVEVRELLDIA